MNYSLPNSATQKLWDPKNGNVSLTKKKMRNYM